MNIIKEQRLKQERSVSLALDYWVVPKMNFENRDKPQIMIDNTLSDTDLQEMEDETGNTHDFSRVYIVDQECPRNVLGKKVRVIRLSDKMTNTTSLGAASRHRNCVIINNCPLPSSSPPLLPLLFPHT